MMGPMKHLESWSLVTLESAIYINFLKGASFRNIAAALVHSSTFIA